MEAELEKQERAAARFPSEAERERALERRLRTLTEQLAAKRAQISSLSADKDSLQRRLAEVTRERRQLQARDGFKTLKLKP
jgi:chromosome segregation ATPase